MRPRATVNARGTSFHRALSHRSIGTCTPHVSPSAAWRLGMSEKTASAPASRSLTSQAWLQWLPPVNPYTIIPAALPARVPCSLPRPPWATLVVAAYWGWLTSTSLLRMPPRSLVPGGTRCSRVLAAQKTLAKKHERAGPRSGAAAIARANLCFGARVAQECPSLRVGHRRA
jgi:hypothetical protein